LAKGIGQGIKDFKKAIKDNEEIQFTTVGQVEAKIEEIDVSLPNKIIN